MGDCFWASGTIKHVEWSNSYIGGGKHTPAPQIHGTINRKYSFRCKLRVAHNFTHTNTRWYLPAISRLRFTIFVSNFCVKFARS